MATPIATVTASHMTQGRVEYESMILQGTEKGLDLWEAISCSPRWKFINLNPTLPSFKGLRIYEEYHCIRLVINSTNAPAYKLTKHLACILEQHAPLPYSFNIRNVVAILMDLKDIP